MNYACSWSHHFGFLLERTRTHQLHSLILSHLTFEWTPIDQELFPSRGFSLLLRRNEAEGASHWCTAPMYVLCAAGVVQTRQLVAHYRQLSPWLWDAIIQEHSAGEWSLWVKKRLILIHSPPPQKEERQRHTLMQRYLGLLLALSFISTVSAWCYSFSFKSARQQVTVVRSGCFIYIANCARLIPSRIISFILHTLWRTVESPGFKKMGCRDHSAWPHLDVNYCMCQNHGLLVGLIHVVMVTQCFFNNTSDEC